MRNNCVAVAALLAAAITAGSTISLAAQKSTTGTLGKTTTTINKGVVERTHCNGTCACTGDDCTKTWVKNNCEGEKADCSTQEGGTDRVCSCVKKAAD
jgi:hypothetical protein